MAVQNQNDLEAASVEVRDETVNNANTATRVGTLLYNLVQTIFANLGQKVEQPDIDDAITLIKASVPVAGDNLLKLYTLITDLQTLVSSDDIDYDTLQEVVDFIKTIDTDGEMIAVVDAAVGNANWRAAYESPLGNPDLDGKVLASTASGVRSWVALPEDGGASFSTQTIDHNADGVITIDFSLGTFVIVNLSANVTSIALTTPSDGKYHVLFVQDATGSRSVDFAGLKTIDGAIPDYSVEANAESLIDVTRANASTYVFGAGNMKVII